MKAKNISFGAVLVALNVLVLFAAEYFPTGRLSFLAAATILMAISLILQGIKVSLIVYICVCILSVFLIPNKLIVTSYIFFFGNYAFVKLLIEKLQKLPLEWFLKILVFNLYYILTNFLINKLFFNINFKFSIWIFWVASNTLFVVFDIALTYFLSKYAKRFIPEVNKWH